MFLNVIKKEVVDESQVEEIINDDVLNILVASDIHLGYAEKDPIRGKDTFVTFEEILKIALNEDVDFVLLGGDLFHEARPSTYCLYKCTEILKRYCLSDRPVQIEFLSDQSYNFSFSNDTVNYEDPNLNIGLPVFQIHGNHDEPTGEEQISALNLLASTGLVNYFGKYNNHASVDIEPILLKKGETKLALYGLSHIRDEKLATLLLNKKVTFMTPEDDWFHLLVLHQNRTNRGAKKFIPDDFLPDLIDLVIWGHEHECRITPELGKNKVYISQPGSSVATSLCLAESRPKHVGLLQIHKNKSSSKMTSIPLKTVRPFVYRDLYLQSLEDMQDDLDVYDDSLTYQTIAEKIVDKEIEEMIEEANNLGQHGNLLPLIGLNVAYVDEKQAFNAIQFGQKYIGRVANPKEMVKLKFLIKKLGGKKNVVDGDEEDFLGGNILPSRVEDLVLELFENNDQKQLKCLSLKALNDSVVKCIDSNYLDAPVAVTQYLINDMRKKLEDESVEIDAVEEFLINLKNQDEKPSFVDEILHERDGTKKKGRTNQDNDDDLPTRASTSTASSGGGPTRPARGRGSRGGKGRAKIT